MRAAMPIHAAGLRMQPAPHAQIGRGGRQRLQPLPDVKRSPCCCDLSKGGVIQGSAGAGRLLCPAVMCCSGCGVPFKQLLS